MATWAQTYEGVAVNIVTGATFDEAVAAVYSPDWVTTEIQKGHPWVVVTDGTKTHATPDGHGGWDNPAPPADVASPKGIAESDYHASQRAKAVALINEGKVLDALAILSTLGG